MTRSGKQLIDLTGQRFGRLIVVRRAPIPDSASYRGARWLCRCDCGDETIVSGHNLRNGSQVSCGCYGRERSADKARVLWKRRWR